MSVLAKTTGDAPEYILPDGSSVPIHRIGPARIQEHAACLHRAAHLGVDALVVEGMALAPETVWQSERILQATHAIITNWRPDHAETMGKGRTGVLRTLSLMIPKGRPLITSSEEGVEDLKTIAKHWKSPIRTITPELDTDQSSSFAIALRDLMAEEKSSGGVGSPILSCVLEAPDRVGQSYTPTCQVIRTSPFCDHLNARFLDLFSANDVSSTNSLLKQNRVPPNQFKVAILATRADRPLRTAEFCQWLAHMATFDLVIPQGDHAGFVWLHYKNKLNLKFVRPWCDPLSIMLDLKSYTSKTKKIGVFLVGLGNSHGAGEKWRNTLRPLCAKGEESGPC